MEIRVQSIKFNADQKLLDYVDKKVARLEKFDDRITSVEVALALMEKPDNKSAKIQAHVPGDNLVIERTARTFEEAITECVDLMKEKMVRNREKRNNE